MGLPPELDRIGAALAHATARATARRRARAERRRRLAGGIAAGLLVFAAMTPAPLDRADQPGLQELLSFAGTKSAQAAGVCDRPRGQRFDVEKTCAGDLARQAVR